jgi:hypothetical protein
VMPSIIQRRRSRPLARARRGSALAKHAEERTKKKRYFARDVHSWDEFVRIVSGHKGRWVYRG